MSRVTTLAPMYWPLMDGPSIFTDHCVVCGARGQLNNHHVVRRSAGKLYRDGIEVPKPTLTLCGFGNALGTAPRLYCHGMAHHGRLHFRYRGRWEFLVTQPCKYADALEMDGWLPLRYGDGK